MNTNPEILTLPAPARARRRRTGKVASLPQAARDIINSALDDGISYQKIIDSLGPQSQNLTTHNLSEWKDGGYQDYLKDKFWREEMRARQETFTNLLAGADALKLPEAGLQLAATGACELLRDLCELNTSSDGKIDPNQFVRVANSLSRLSRSILTLQQYRDDAVKTQTLELKELDKDRELAHNERTALLDRADDLFGFRSYLRIQAELAKAAPPSPEPNPTIPTPAEPAAGNLQPATPPPQPDIPSPQPASNPESTNPPIHQSVPEHCPECGALLPALLQTGERPTPYCECGLYLPPPKPATFNLQPATNETTAPPDQPPPAPADPAPDNPQLAAYLEFLNSPLP